METWLENLKSGDLVIVAESSSNMVTKVTKVTKERIVIGDDRYNIKDGTGHGDYGITRGDYGWRPAPYLIEATAARIDKVKADQRRFTLVNKARDIDFLTLSIDQLEKIVEIVEAEGEKASVSK